VWYIKLKRQLFYFRSWFWFDRIQSKGFIKSWIVTMPMILPRRNCSVVGAPKILFFNQDFDKEDKRV
jgi:hypothetical protein